MARYRPVFTDIWVCDDKFQDYSVEGKLLFLFLITNDHLEESGIYKITYKTISNETDIPREKVKELINEEIKNNVSYDDKNSVIFVHKFLKFSGGGNPELIKKSIEKGKRLIKTTLWNKFYNYYTRDLKPIENNLEIFPSNSIPNATSNSIPKEGRESEYILNLLSKVKDYPFNEKRDREFIVGLIADFPDLDALEEIKKKCAWWLSNPILKKSNPHLQLRNWFINARKYLKEGDKSRDVGKSYMKEKEFLPMLLLGDIYKIILAKGESIEGFYDLAKSVFPKIKDEWEKSDKKPETFIRLVEGQ